MFNINTQTTLRENNRNPDKEFLRFYRSVPTAIKDKNNILSNWLPEEPKMQLKYTQDWVAYDRAKCNEDVLFKRLLAELLHLTLEEKQNTGAGRPSYSQRDRIFGMCVKEYYKADNRKAISVLKELKNLNLVYKVPCHKSLSNFYNDSALSTVLDKLILLSALPLAKLESTGAIDATGFSTSRYECWNEYKWGQHSGKERIWRKLHAMVGCKTNVFLSAKVTEKNVADVRMLQDVVGVNTKYFRMEDFTADKAYSSRAVFKFIEKLGMTPYIPFKKNAKGDPKGVRIWREMFDHFHTSPDEFNNAYHQRSNVETSFHMLKARFGSQLKTKHFTANVNEIKARVLCCNITILIQEAFESGINLDLNEVLAERWAQ